LRLTDPHVRRPFRPGPVNFDCMHHGRDLRESNIMEATLETPPGASPDTQSGGGQRLPRASSHVLRASTGSPPRREAVVRRGVFYLVLVIVIDQLSKALGTWVGNTAVTHPVTNDRFSLGLAGGSLSTMVLVTVAGIVLFGAYVTWQAVCGRLSAWVPGLLMGGALSNLLDRLVLGAVRDFMATPWVLWNLADLAVLLGIAGYALGHLHRPEPTTNHPEEVNLT
jgi:signal peptidase II